METLMDVQRMLTQKTLEKTQCEQKAKTLRILCLNMKNQTKEWVDSYKKHNKLIVTSDVVVTGHFQGKKAQEIKTLYHERISHMNNKYMGKIAKVYEDLQSQISYIENHISDLEDTIKNLETKIENMGG